MNKQPSVGPFLVIEVGVHFVASPEVRVRAALDLSAEFAESSKESSLRGLAS
jgi:hypothetical protein